MLSVFAILGVIFLLAFLTESMVEYVFGAIVAHVDKLKPYAWLTMYLAMAVGIAGAFIYKFDLIYLVAQFMGAPIAVHPMGIILTGMSIGRGANYLHDLVSRYFVKPTP